MRDFGDSTDTDTIDYPLMNPSIKGFGKWKFAVVQNTVTGGNRGIIIKMHCAEDCPSDNSTALTWMDTRFTSEGKEIFGRSSLLLTFLGINGKSQTRILLFITLS
jgi:hypothetical protein